MAPPDPGDAASLDDLARQLRLLKIWAGDPSYETITARVNAARRAEGRPARELTGRTTVLDCFRPGRRRVDADLVAAVVAALHPDPGYVGQWRQALRVVTEEAHAAAQVRVEDRLPPDPGGFIGRTAELRRIRETLRRDDAPVVCAIAGMAGVGKTRLAIRAAHAFLGDRLADRVLFVNLRGFHPEAAQPPADPAAVLEGFLRLLGVPGQQIPHGLDARIAAYHRRLAGTRTLVVLDNAAGPEQVRPLLPAEPGCPALVTSRRRLTILHPATALTVGVFTPEESAAFLAGVAPSAPAGRDPDAAGRISRRCGHLPLALGLVGAHIRDTPGWTLTDHAERLDAHRHHRRPDLGVALALDLSYERLPAADRELLRLAALHPGQDFDAYAVAAAAGSDPGTAGAGLERLQRDHLLQPGAPGRYTLHDLVRAFALDRAGDEDSPSRQRAVLTRLFDHYLAAAATAMDALYPAESHRRPHVERPDTPLPPLDRAWLDTERPVLLAVAGHAAAHGWPGHCIRLAGTLFQYLGSQFLADAVTIHSWARLAARQAGDLAAEADALTNLGVTDIGRGEYAAAAAELRVALRLFRLAGRTAGEARALVNLGVVEALLGRHGPAAEHYTRAVALFEAADHLAGEAHALNSLGEIEGLTGQYGPALAHIKRAVALYRRLGDTTGIAWALTTLGDVERLMGRAEPAAGHLREALVLYRRLGNRLGEAWALHYLGEHEQALALFEETGDRRGTASARNGLGETSPAADALAHHAEALAIAVATGDRLQEARAHAGLGTAHRALGDPERARPHLRRARELHTELGVPE